jgi:rhamnulokinase
VHVVGGGVRNRLLCQMIADATGRPVVAGPVEATAIGNLLVQLAAREENIDLPAMREIVRRSFATESFAPRAPAAWDARVAR